MNGLTRLEFIFEKWFEDYDIEFGTYDGTILLHFENNTIEQIVFKFKLYLPAERVNRCE